MKASKTFIIIVSILLILSCEKEYLPEGAFIAINTNITEGDTVQFTDQSTNNPTSWSWDFGDGNISSEQHPFNTYTLAGAYTVKLTVKNVIGADTLTKANYIAVLGGNAPVADFITDKDSIIVGESIQFADRSRFAPTNWTWNFGDGVSSTEQNPSHTYLESGIFTIKLTVTNRHGMDSVTKSENIVVIEGFITGKVSDIEGNIYTTVIINNKEWMAMNLKAEKYNDGSSIAYVSNKDAWVALKTPAYCWYNNDEETSYRYKYGAMYNWYAVNSGKLCPIGWHVPTNEEWTALETYLISNGYNFDGSTNGNKIGKSLAAKSGWIASSNIGAVGNDQQSNNATGFTAVTVGVRYHDGEYYDDGLYSNFWSASEYDTNNAYVRYLDYNWFSLKENNFSKIVGISVRCVKD